MSENNEDRSDVDSAPSAPSSRIFIPHSRRSTIIFSTVQNGKEPYENPNNPPHVNANLRREYETVKQLNTAIEQVIQSVENTSEMMSEFAKTVDHTESIMKMWREVLVSAEKKKTTLDNIANPPPVFKKPTTPVKPKSGPSGPGSVKKRRRLIRSQR